MAMISRNQWIGGTIKSANRLRHIVAVFAKHGFQNIIEDLDLGKYLLIEKLSGSKLSETYSTPERLRMAFEQLGPTWIKFGQVLASRPDIVPEDFIKELKVLQDNAPTLPYSQIKKLIEKEYKKDLKEIFSYIDETPLGAASIAQVHKAKLVTGEDVVIKVQRPGIREMIQEDVQAIYSLSLLIEKYSPELKSLNLSDMVEEYASALEQELDFVIESSNIQRFRRNFYDDPHVVIPKVYTEISTHTVLVLEELKGLRLSDPNAFEQDNITPADVVHIGLRTFFKMIFNDGIFHADLHAGNIFVLPNQKLGLVDFGMVGYISTKSRDSIAGIMMSLASEDYEQLTHEFLELSPFTYNCDADAFTHDIQSLFAPYHGLSFANFQVGKLLLESTRIATKHGIRLPSDLMLLFKSILTVEGMGRSLGEDIDLLSFSNEFASEVIKSKYNYNRLLKQAGILAKDSSALVSDLPRQTRQALKKFNSPEFHWKIQLEDIRGLKRSVETGSNIIFLGMIIGSMIMAGTAGMFLDSIQFILGVPAFSFIMFSLASITGLVAFYNYIKK